MLCFGAWGTRCEGTRRLEEVRGMWHEGTEETMRRLWGYHEGTMMVYDVTLKDHEGQSTSTCRSEA